MHKFETHFITENVAPVGAEHIELWKNDASGKPVRTVGKVLLGGLDSGLQESKKQFSVCFFSDIHVKEDEYPTSTEDFRRGLTYANANCAFTIISGDLVSTGGVKAQLENYAAIVAQFSPDKPVYSIAGNHENYNGYADGTNGYHLKDYTGYPLYYSFGVDDDGQRVAMDIDQTPLEYGDEVNTVFVMVGHYGSWHDGNWQSTEFISMDELQWLYDTLEANRNKRCVVVTHVLPWEHGVGNPCNLYSDQSAASRLWNVNDGGIGQAFIDLLCHYRNTLLVHGHSHTRFALQELDPKANYAEVKLPDGRSYKSLHVPSLAVPRRKDPDGDPKPLEDLTAESEGSVIDFYPNCVVHNGRDFGEYDADTETYKDPRWLPAATYKINTTIVTVAKGTFVDSTGLIQTEVTA